VRQSSALEERNEMTVASSKTARTVLTCVRDDPIDRDRD
jgi:hypothetical protein